MHYTPDYIPMTSQPKSRSEYNELYPEPLLEHCPQLIDADDVNKTEPKRLYIDLHTAQEHLQSVPETLGDSSQINSTLDTCCKLLDEAHTRSEDPAYPYGTIDDLRNLQLRGTFETIAENIEQARTFLEQAIDNPSTDSILQLTTDALALVERSLTKLGTHMHHDSYSSNQFKNENSTGCNDYCIWDSVEAGTIDAEGASVPGTCVLCGKQYDQYFEFRGIFDNDAGEYVMQK